MYTRFEPRSVFILKLDAPKSKYWYIIRGNKKKLVLGFYQAFQKVYGFLTDKDRITKIRIEITREK